MKKTEFIKVNPDDISNAVFLTLGEGFEHVDEFTDQAGYEWRTWCQAKDKKVPLIRNPLLGYWAGLSSVEQLQLKWTLQYLLNIDEAVPYQSWKNFPELKSKDGGIGAKYFASYQDTIQPYDWYELCLWMWEILFPTEDWHIDVSAWIVTEKATLYAKT